MVGIVPSEVEKGGHQWPDMRASAVYCHGPLLDAVQRAEIFADSKTFVDRPMKYDPEVILNKFQELSSRGKLTPSELKTFVEENFEPVGGELDLWTPPDWTEHPSLVDKVASPYYKEFILKLNHLWKILGRQIKPRIAEHPDRHSLLHVPHPFIVPGDRFGEFYYWDTYWIINGLLLCDMTSTAKNMIENFLFVMDRYSIIPNGGRIYYLTRSQPPLLTPMVDLYYTATKDLEFVRKALPTLEKEYNYWRQNHTVAVEKNGIRHLVSRYVTKLDQARPEGYMEDLETVKGMTPDEAVATYKNLAAACESGWDFSSRWFGWEGEDRMTLRSIRTDKIIPTDLNTFLHWVEQLLAKFSRLIGDTEKAETYERYADARSEAITALLWNEEDGIWYDYDIEKQTQRKKYYLSNIFPLLTTLNNDFTERTVISDKVVNYINKNQIQLSGGMPTSFEVTGQQWDFPNAWSPLVSLVVSALSNSGSLTAQKMAYNISRTWLETNYVAYQKHCHMYEKYNAQELGGIGGGGEYNVQVGFGWTNGVVLELLDKYGDILDSPPLSIQSATDTKLCAVASAAAVTSLVIFVAVIVIFRRKRRTTQDKLYQSLSNRELLEEEVS